MGNKITEPYDMKSISREPTKTEALMVPIVIFILKALTRNLQKTATEKRTKRRKWLCYSHGHHVISQKLTWIVRRGRDRAVAQKNKRKSTTQSIKKDWRSCQSLHEIQGDKSNKADMSTFAIIRLDFVHLEVTFDPRTRWLESGSEHYDAKTAHRESTYRRRIYIELR